ncbi:hypothetical protein GCM10010833_08890 [Blastomonas aquatica]|uniref:Uncharacterized protein n=1 Tax=Blastomonas aquatica TaxID=1510276 RepID=A0ABQ1J021_9SPHN|nr:hypothetical protein GCM10010833_08890 [Blastomonas aquatica]
MAVLLTGSAIVSQPPGSTTISAMAKGVALPGMGVGAAGSAVLWLSVNLAPRLALMECVRLARGASGEYGAQASTGAIPFVVRPIAFVLSRA